MKRREFLAKSAAAGTALSMAQLVRGAASGLNAKSRVVIANDPQSYANSTLNATRIQDMVDHAIMTLTGKTTKGAAYEALFPRAVTATTKIVLKYNDGTGASLASLAAVRTALRSGLTSMLGGTFPAANVTDFSKNSATTGPQFSIGSTSYSIKSGILDCDYFINVPVCWATSATMAGVTMSLKQMMSAVGVGALGNMHSNFTSATTPALAILNSQQTFKDKQVLVLMDAIDINYSSGPNTQPNGTAYSIIASKDMVAADYQGMLILKAKGLPSAAETAARTVFENAAKAPYSIGTNDPNSMEVLNISPPWTTRVSWQGERSEALGLQVRIGTRNGRPHVVFGLDRGATGPAELSIIAADGSEVWSASSLEWNGETASGRAPAAGAYAYALRTSGGMVRGTIVVER